jgi:hypothetical protein
MGRLKKTDKKILQIIAAQPSTVAFTNTEHEDTEKQMHVCCYALVEEQGGDQYVQPMCFDFRTKQIRTIERLDDIFVE